MRNRRIKQRHANGSPAPRVNTTAAHDAASPKASTPESTVCHEALSRVASDDHGSEPFCGEVRAGKNTQIYNVHSYSTKVPYQAILPFIAHFTQPGEVVLDPFCGSGMTGVASLLLGRSATLLDIAPAAVHIASNYTTACDAGALTSEAQRILATIETEVSDLYATRCDRCGGPATIQYSVWSDVFECPICRGEISYWHAAVDLKAGSVRPLFNCSTCGTTVGKRDLTWKRSAPVSTKYSCNAACGRLTERPITAAELELSRRVESEPIVDWYPSTPFGSEREMWRKSHEVMGITSLDGFYTRRNLRTLALLWREIRGIADTRLRSALSFAFTGIVNRASRRYQWNAKRPTNVQTGTLYIASLNYEWNVSSLFRRKFRDVLTYYRSHTMFPGKATVIKGSATDLHGIEDNSIDYVFTDPPFGGNIYYADCALLWESWLDEYTDDSQEIVIHRKRRNHGGNSLADYQRLMTQSFVRVCQVLKPGRAASVVFHSSDPQVWRAIQVGVRDAGLELLNTTALDKGQPSIKGLKGQRGKERVAAVDVILNLRKPASARAVLESSHIGDLKAFLVEALAAHLRSLSDRIAAEPETFSREMRRTQYLHSLAVRTILHHQIPMRDVSYGYVEELCQEYFDLRGEYWYLPGDPTPIEKAPAQLLLENVIP
jgi:DNA modification methylase